MIAAHTQDPLSFSIVDSARDRVGLVRIGPVYGTTMFAAWEDGSTMWFWEVWAARRAIRAIQVLRDLERLCK